VAGTQSNRVRPAPTTPRSQQHFGDVEHLYPKIRGRKGICTPPLSANLVSALIEPSKVSPSKSSKSIKSAVRYSKPSWRVIKHRAMLGLGIGYTLGKKFVFFLLVAIRRDHSQHYLFTAHFIGCHASASCFSFSFPPYSVGIGLLGSIRAMV